MLYKSIADHSNFDTYIIGKGTILLNMGFCIKLFNIYTKNLFLSSYKNNLFNSII
jgi:hypothetical protein